MGEQRRIFLRTPVRKGSQHFGSIRAAADAPGLLWFFSDKVQPPGVLRNDQTAVRHPLKISLCMSEHHVVLFLQRGVHRSHGFFQPCALFGIAYGIARPFHVRVHRVRRLVKKITPHPFAQGCQLFSGL